MAKKLIAIPMALAVVFALGGASSAHAQVAAPAVQIQMLTTGLTSPLVASSTGATVARLQVNTTGSGEPVSISSLPFILSVANGALPSSLFNCQVFNESNPTVSLTASSSNVLSAGRNNIALNSPLILQPNTSTVLDLRCDVASNLVAGGTYTFSMNTSDLVATGTITGRQATVTVIGTTVNPGICSTTGAINFGGALPCVFPTVQTPGLPTTGASGNAPRNIAILMGTVLAAGMGFALRKTRIKKA